MGVKEKLHFVSQLSLHVSYHQTSSCLLLSLPSYILVKFRFVVWRICWGSELYYGATLHMNQTESSGM